MSKISPSNHRSMFLIAIAGAVVATCAGGGQKAIQTKADAFAPFFAAYESADFAAALASLPPEIREASLYDAASEALPPYQRDIPVYEKISSQLDGSEAIGEAALAESALHYGLGVLAGRAGEWETARRRLLLALLRDPFNRMAHIYLARVYRHLEDEALKGADDGGDPGAVLMAKVGFGASDLHIDLAQDILDRDTRPNLPALAVTFQYDKGAVKDFKAQWTTASGNARLQRQAANAEPGSCRVELCGPDRLVLDEKPFAPSQTIFWDGLDENKKPIGGKDSLTTFTVSLELLSLTPGALVIIYDPAGRKIFSAPAPAFEPAGLK